MSKIFVALHRPDLRDDAMIDVFIAGGISNCADWQSTAMRELDGDDDVIIMNPRRQTGFAKTGSSAAQQIAWEHEYLSKARCILFWFPASSICPITLYELGWAISQPGKKIIVGYEPGYARSFDILTQLHLAAPSIHVHDDLQDVLQETKDYLSSTHR
jgi:hypothetical protein